MFDLAVALDHPDVESERIIKVFVQYMEHGGHHVTREQFLSNLAAKLDDETFGADIGPLLAGDYQWDLEAMADRVRGTLIDELPE